MNIALYIGTYFFYKILNRRRDKIWNSWSKKVRTCICKRISYSAVLQEQEEYLETTKDKGNERLDFRFAY